jgi:formate dehydrogenase maturation protein FdhE
MSLLARAEARWQQIEAEVPAEALRLHRRLLTRQIGLVEDGAVTPPDLRVLDGRAVERRLGTGRPVLRDIHVPGVPVARVAAAMLAFLDELAWGGAGEAARKIARALERGTLDLPSVCAASLARDEPATRALAAEGGLNLQVLWMAADLVTAPIANAIQETLLTEGDEGVRQALAGWSRGTCPACGNWPALAEFFFGERLHRCAYCAAAWRIESRGCTSCGEQGEHFRTVPIDRRRPGKRLEVCRRCGAYLKTIDVASPAPFPLLAIEDFATADLDRAAAAHGFRRTALRGD